MQRSSIFNSKNIAEFAHLPRRTYAWLACICLTFAAIAVVSSFALDRKLSTRFKRPMPPFIERGEVMILGDSTLLYLKTWDYPVRDFALPSCGYLMQKSIFDANAPRMPNLHVLIMSLSVLDYYKRDVEARQGDFRDLIDWGVPWHELPGISRAEQFAAFVRYNKITAPFLIGPKLDINTLARVSLFPFELKPDSAPKDFEVQPDKKSKPIAAPAKPAPPPEPAVPAPAAKSSDIVMTSSPSAGKSALTKEESATLAAYARHLLPYLVEASGEPKAHHKNALFDIIASCRERGVQPVFIKTPSPGGLLWSAPITQKRVADLYAEIQAKFPDMNIPVWEAEKEQGIYGVDLFKDHLHLNEKGLAKFNEFLNAKLSALPTKNSSVPLMDSFRHTSDLLLPSSPTDRPTVWARNTGVTTTAIAVPSAVGSQASYAARVVLPPKTALYITTESPVLPGTTCDAHIWLWAEKLITSKVRFVLARHGDKTDFEGAVLQVKELTDKPKKFGITATFNERHPKLRVEIRNDSAEEQTVFMATPSLTNRL